MIFSGSEIIFIGGTSRFSKVGGALCSTGKGIFSIKGKVGGVEVSEP
jgi:hypothetical protein